MADESDSVEPAKFNTIIEDKDGVLFICLNFDLAMVDNLKEDGVMIDTPGAPVILGYHQIPVVVQYLEEIYRRRITKPH